MARSLTEAILYETPEKMEAFIKAGVNINEIDDYGFTPLIETAIVNDVEKAKTLIAHNVDINKTSVSGHTALHWAADNDNVALCRLLLENKANPNAYTSAGQPVLVYPLLREQNDLKQLLYQHGASLIFAQDYINTKLVGHRYSLAGQVDIINAQNEFVEIDYEGFYLEFTISLLQNSLSRYVKNFTARHLRIYFDFFKKIIDALAIAAELIKYQQYTTDLAPLQNRIDSLLNSDLLLIPIGYQGHAITMIKYHDWWIRCDRGEVGRRTGTVIIYRIGQLQRCNKEFIKKLLYANKSKSFIESGIHKLLELTPITQLPLEPQLTGNCSWANAEASIPSMLFLLLLVRATSIDESILTKSMVYSMALYQQWLEWDKDRSLEDCIQSFNTSNPARKASKAATLGSVLFQACNAERSKDLERAEKILSVLTLPDYDYILKSYVKAFFLENKTPFGENLVDILKYHEIEYR